MSTTLKKKFNKPDLIEGAITVKEYYKELKRAFAGLPPGANTSFFYIPAFSFKPDPSSDEGEDIKPLLWLGEYSSAWERILKPKAKYASGGLVVRADENVQDLVLTLKDGVGAKPIIAKKVARYVKKATKIQVDFDFAEDILATSLLREAQAISASTASPYVRIVKEFNYYQSAPILRKVTVLLRLNSLFETWEAYDDVLKAEEQRQKVLAIQQHLEDNVRILVQDVEQFVVKQQEEFAQRLSKHLKAEAPDVEHLGEVLVKMLIQAERLQTKIHRLEKVIQSNEEAVTWFSPKMSHLAVLNKTLRMQDVLMARHVKAVKKWLKQYHIHVQTSGISEQELRLQFPVMNKMPTAAIDLLHHYEAVLTNGERLLSRAPTLQQISMLLLETLATLDANKHPWVALVRTQIWEKKDLLGSYYYENDNYQKILKLYDVFGHHRRTFDRGNAEKRVLLKDKLLDLIEDLGVEISEWEEAHLEFNTFEIKERGKYIESIRRIITAFLREDLRSLFDDKSEIDDLLKSSVFIFFSNQRSYNASIRKYIEESLALRERVEEAYARCILNQKALNRPTFNVNLSNQIISDCQQIQQNINIWSLQAQRCNLADKQLMYEADQEAVHELLQTLQKCQASTQDVAYLLAAFEKETEALKELEQSIETIKKELETTQKLLSTQDNGRKQELVLHIAHLRSNLIQQEQQLHAISSLLLAPYQRLKNTNLSITAALPVEYQKQLDGWLENDIPSKIEQLFSERKREHDWRYKNIIEAYESYQVDKTKQTQAENRSSCTQIIEAIYAVEQALIAEEAFMKKLLKDQKQRSSLLASFQLHFKNMLETFKFIRLSVNDDLEQLLDTESVPVREELYTTIQQIYEAFQNSDDLELLLSANQKVQHLYENWAAFNQLRVGESQKVRYLSTALFKEQKTTLKAWIEALKQQLMAVGKQQQYWLSSLEKIQHPAFEQMRLKALHQLGIIEHVVGTAALNAKLLSYKKHLEYYRGTHDEQLYAMLVELTKRKLKLAKRSEVRSLKFILAYEKILTTPINFARSMKPVKKMREIQQKIEHDLQRLMQEHLVAVRDLEGQFFAAMGNDFDFYRSPKTEQTWLLSTQKAALMKTVYRDIAQRFNALVSIGASQETLRKNLEHIPISCWSNEWLDILQRQEKETIVNQETLEEQHQQLIDIRHQQLENGLKKKTLFKEGAHQLLMSNKDVEELNMVLSFCFGGAVGATQELRTSLSTALSNGLIDQYKNHPQRLGRILWTIDNVGMLEGRILLGDVKDTINGLEQLFVLLEGEEEVERLMLGLLDFAQQVEGKVEDLLIPTTFERYRQLIKKGVRLLNGWGAWFAFVQVVTEPLSMVEQGVVVEIVNDVLVVMEQIDTLLNELSKGEVQTDKILMQLLTSTPVVMQNIQEQVLGMIEKHMERVGGIDTIVQLFENVLDVSRSLSLANQVLDLKNRVAEVVRMIKDRKAYVGVDLHPEWYDDDLLKMKHWTVGKGERADRTRLYTSGGLFQYKGTTIQLGTKVIFTEIDETAIATVQELVQDAQNDNRKAKATLFENAVFSAKQYVIGLIRDAVNGQKQAEALAKDYCLQYGISDKYFTRETAELILRRIFQFLPQEKSAAKLIDGIKTLGELVQKKLERFAGDKLMTALLDEIQDDFVYLEMRLNALKRTNNASENLGSHQLNTALLPFIHLKKLLQEERMRLEKLELAQKATYADLGNMKKVQHLIEILGRHSI